ncbi:MAG: TetR family transcriptional regulator C-terminal domain-containing protein [Rhizobiales bacterium]|nr:TetR family transcriptional regulator C-terminal domain-containing protein [Hyphomicrobiales bacterium]
MASSAIRKQETPPPRKASREHRRQQLIEATVECLARRGYAQTTLSDVANLAGLSHGLVNFHFETKQKLLIETLLFLAAEYRENWIGALAAAPPSPEHQLEALITADFNETVCTQNKLTAWCAFWGEAQSRPIYQETCGSNDLKYVAMLEGICDRLIKNGGFDLDAARVARILRVTVEGLWLDLMSLNTPDTREEAKRTAFTCAAAFFPKHFDEAGLRP